MKIAFLSPNSRPILRGVVIVGSVLLCFLLSLTRLPGMELLGIGPNWLVIWLVTWSLKHRVLPSVMAGMALGLIADGLTSAYPSHIISLVLVAFLTARMHRHRPIQDSMIAAVWIVFAMALLGETVLAIQYGLEGISPIEDIWKDYQRIALSSALLSSLWAPVLYYPLSRWWINRAG